MKTKKILLLCLGIAALLVWQLTQRGTPRPGSPNVRNATQTGRSIVAFGDGLAGTDGFPQPLTAALGHEVQVLGQEAETSPAALVRVDQVIALKPNFAIVSLGTEDLRARVPLDETLAALDTIFSRLTEAGALVVYLAVDVPGIGDNWAMAIDDLCETRGVLVVNGATHGLWSNPDELEAKVKLDDAERQVVADRIHSALKSLL